MLRYGPSIHTLMRVFLMNGCWILSNEFFMSINMITWFFSYLWLMWCFTFIDLHILNHLCDSWMILFMYCWIWFPNILFRILPSIFGRDIGLKFCINVLNWFSHQGNAGCKELVGSYFLLFSFLESLYRIVLFLSCIFL